MSLQLYNTLTRRKEVFSPADPERVTMYVCGPTVYSYAHIGNARPAVVFDTLYRLLMRRYPQVVYARNITDVEDKINRAAKEQGVSIDVITKRFAAAYHEDMRALGVLPPTIEPRATEHVGEMIAMIERLIELGHAYASDGHVLFEVASYARYGALGRRNRRELVAGARVEVAPYKKDAADFVLWKPSSADLPGWDSPWGRGRPGWHIECSAMIEAHLGTTIDIHGGGNDLIFPHHENEIGQSNCAHGDPLARFWVHNGHLNVNSEKMSKSLGNVLVVRELLDVAKGEAIRFALLSAHYRKPLEWTHETLGQANRELDRLYGVVRDLDLDPQAAEDHSVPEGFLAALDDDLNTPLARAKLFELGARAHAAENAAERRRLGAQLLAAGRFLGILGQTPSTWFSTGAGQGPSAEEVERLVALRNRARASGDYEKADRIRDQLATLGVALEDGAEGTRWKRTG